MDANSQIASEIREINTVKKSGCILRVCPHRALHEQKMS